MPLTFSDFSVKILLYPFPSPDDSSAISTEIPFIHRTLGLPVSFLPSGIQSSSQLLSVCNVLKVSFLLHQK
jgi:hypothetical protein